MKYVIMGLLVGLGWHVAKLLYNMAHELLFSELHRIDWLGITSDKTPKNIKDSKNKHSVENKKIGFY